MTPDDFRRVEAWLHSIPRLKIALETLRVDLEKIESKAASPPSWVSNLNISFARGGKLDSRQEKWVEFIEEYPLRKAEITDAIRDRKQQMACFERVMGMLQEENAQLAQLVNCKYIKKMRPDSNIYDNDLYVSRRTFYRMRNYIVEAFFECLPGQFPQNRAS